jgi:hypothetical protein
VLEAGALLRAVGVRLLDGGLELRREVHRRHELIEREPLRRRHGLTPRPSGPRRWSCKRHRALDTRAELPLRGDIAAICAG